MKNAHSNLRAEAAIVDSVIRSRKAIRSFRPDPVLLGDVRAILDVARSAPSNSNTQPWNVFALAGTAKQRLSDALRCARETDHHSPLKHLPEPLPDAYRARQEAFGVQYYRSLGIEKSDVEARARATGRNFDFFGAPVGLIFTIDERMTKYSWLDCGLFIQSVMIAARGRGLDSCPQVAFARYHDVIAAELQLPPGHVVVCGMSLGYADIDASVNQFETERVSVEDFAKLMGFDE